MEFWHVVGFVKNGGEWPHHPTAPSGSGGPGVAHADRCTPPRRLGTVATWLGLRPCSCSRGGSASGGSWSRSCTSCSSFRSWLARLYEEAQQQSPCHQHVKRLRISDSWCRSHTSTFCCPCSGQHWHRWYRAGSVHVVWASHLWLMVGSYARVLYGHARAGAP